MFVRSGLYAAGLICIAAVSRGDEARSAPASSECRTWVAQLNDDEYAVREEAARQLATAGTAAIEALVEGLASDQAEVAWRCGAALEQIGLEADDATIDRIVQLIDAACVRSGRQGLKSLAKDLHVRQRQFRRERAIGILQKHGGQITGDGTDGEIGADFGGGFFAGPAAPAIIFDEPIGEVEAMEIPVPLEEVEPALPRVEVLDIFAGIGRLLGRAVAPPAEDAKAALKESDDHDGAEKPVEADGVAAVALADAADAVVAEVAVAEVTIAADSGELGGWAQLRLDANWRGGDDGLSVVKDIPELTQIDLHEAKLTDKGLEHLVRLPRLQQLNVYQAGFSRDALIKFHRRRPGVTVYARGEGMMGIHGDMSSSPLVLTSVQEGSGAAQAGLQPGDIVHKIDGVKIRDFSDLTICVSARKAGERIDVVYERDGKTRTVQVTLSPREE